MTEQLESRILEVVRTVSRPDLTPEPDEQLFENGMLDSFALPDLISALEQEFEITIPDGDMSPRKFQTLARIAAYVSGKLR